MLTKNIEKFASLTRQHAEADLLVQGTYYDEDTGKACFIGCFAHGNRPEVIAEEFGIPVMLSRIAERIFEALPKGEDLDFFLAVPGAIGSDGKDLSRVGWAFLADTLRAMPPQDGAVKQAVDDVISGLDRLAAGGEWLTAARAKADAVAEAANAAEAARAKADAAAEAANAAEAAWAAAWAAEAARAAEAANAAEAAWAAGLAAEAARAAEAANGRQRDAFLRLVSEAPVLGSSGGEA